MDSINSRLNAVQKVMQAEYDSTVAKIAALEAIPWRTAAEDVMLDAWQRHKAAILHEAERLGFLIRR